MSFIIYTQVHNHSETMGLVRFFEVSSKSDAHQGWIYLIKKHSKNRRLILWNIIKIVNNC